MAQPRGSVPTTISATTLKSARVTTETVLLTAFVTYASLSFGCRATQRGSSPTATSASVLVTSCRAANRTSSTEIVFASRFTTTKRRSSDVRAMVDELDAVASLATLCLSSSSPPQPSTVNVPASTTHTRRFPTILFQLPWLYIFTSPHMHISLKPVTGM